jgi:hypothetical protein
MNDDRLQCLGCGKVHPGAQLVTLHDGRQVGSYSEDWRLECEAIFVVTMPTLAKRRNYLDMVKEKRGVKGWSTLTDRVAAIWQASKDAQPKVAQNIGSAAVDTPTNALHRQAGKTANFLFDF